jgi:hypothetical protein
MFPTDSVYLSKSHGGFRAQTKPDIFARVLYTMDNICKTKTKNECKVSDSCVFLNDVSCVGTTLDRR